MFPYNLPAVVYLQQNNILCYSAHADPIFDEGKGRVVKGLKRLEGQKFPTGFSTVAGVSGVKGWNDKYINKEDPQWTLAMCQVGRDSGFIIIDLDINGEETVEETFPKEMLDRLHESCMYVVESGSKGLHFYYRMPEEGTLWTIKKNAMEFAGYDVKGQLDVLANGIGVILPGSYYKFQKHTYLYKVLSKKEDGSESTLDDVGEMPDWLIEACDEVCEKETVKQKKKKEVAVEVKEEDEEEQVEQSVAITPAPRDRSVSPDVRSVVNEINLIQQLVDKCLPASFFIPWDNWNRFIRCMKSIQNTSACKELCVKACRKSKKHNTDYHEQCTRERWEKVVANGGMTMGSLRYWCRTYSEAKYNEILRESYMFLLQGSVNAVAECFAQDIAGTIVADPTTKEPTYWRYNEDQRLWNSITESSLEYYFVELMPSLCDRVRRDILRNSPGDEKVAETAKKIGGIGGKIASGNGSKYIKPLRTILNTGLTSTKYTDREFALNERPELLPLKNGVFNFQTGALEPYDRTHYLSYKIDINYNPNADTKNIEDAFNKWFINDQEKIDFMQYWLGYCLTGFNDRHEFLIVYGSKGGNGKSVLFERIMGQIIMGKNLCINLSEDALCKKGGHNDSLANAKGKRLCILAEAGAKGGSTTGFNVEGIKKLTGGGLCTANAKHKNEIEYEFTGKLALQTNQPLNLPADDGGIARRIRYVEMNVEFVPEEKYMEFPQDKRDAGLVHKQDPQAIKALEENKEGWIKWLIDGAMKYMANPKKMAPQSILAFTEESRASGDVYSNWIVNNLLFTGKVEDELKMADISPQFLKDSGRNPNDGKAKAELASRLTKRPAITTSGNGQRGRLIIHGAKWRIGCNPDLSEEEADKQVSTYNVFLKLAKLKDSEATQLLFYANHTNTA